MPLSVTIITRNAGALLEDCLNSASFADEILVVDSGSTDATADVAARHGARVVQKDWLGFGPQKQFAVEIAAHDWVLCLDADERLSAELRHSIIAELRAPRGAAYAMARCNRFLGRWLRHGEGYPDWSVRLFDRRQARWSADPVHEKVIAPAPAQRLSGDLMHQSAETLEHYLDKRTHQPPGRRHGGTGPPARCIFCWRLLRASSSSFPAVDFDGVPGLVHV